MSGYNDAVEEQLFKALQEDGKKTKNYHIRQALQIYAVENVPEEVDLNPQIRKVE
mgnify:CR=1 FL=1|jgi:hypothetical protein